MKKSALKNHERALKWEKRKEEKVMEQIILSRVAPIVEKMSELALEGNLDASKYLLDRVFGKPTTTMDVQSDGNPIIFMPTVLVNKFNLNKEEPQVLSKEDTKLIDARPRQTV